MAVTWNTQVATVTWTAVDDPSVTWVVQVDATVTGGGGGGGGVALGETSTTAYRGDRGKTAYDHSQVTTGNPHGTTAADVGADPAGTAAGLVDDLSGVSNQATARANLGLGTAAVTDTGTGSSNVILGNDARLTDSRTPTSHNHAASEITSGTIDQARLGTGSAGAGAKFLADDQTYKTVSSGIADPGGSNDDIMQRKSGAWTYRTPAQVRADLGVTGATEFMGTKWVIPGAALSTQANAAIAANHYYFAPIVVTEPLTVAGMGWYVAIGASGKLIRNGIFNASSTWRPTTLVDQTASTSVTTSAAVTTANLSAGNATLTPGRYLLATVCDGTPTLSWLRAAAAGSGVMAVGSWVASNGYSFVNNGALAFTYGSMASNPGTPAAGSGPAGYPTWLVLA